MHIECRSGEQEKHWFRTGRVYNMAGKWYFATREKDQVGPFTTREQVESEVGTFVDYMKDGGEYASYYYFAHLDERHIQMQSLAS